MILNPSSSHVKLVTETPLTLPWYKQPAGYIPLGVGVLLLLVALVLKLRKLPSYLRAKRRKHPLLDPEQLEEIMMGDPPRIVDLRPPDEYGGKRGHIRGALSIPFHELEKRLKELDPEHPRAVVLVDETDELSHLAADILIKHGYRWLYVLKGGYRAWRTEKMPIYGGVDPKKR